MIYGLTGGIGSGKTTVAQQDSTVCTHCQCLAQHLVGLGRTHRNDRYGGSVLLLEAES